MRSFLNIFFKVVSIVGHPILLPTYFSLSISDLYGVSTLGISLITIVIPVLVMFFAFVITEVLRARRSAADGLSEIEMQMRDCNGIFAKMEQFFEATHHRTLALAVLVASAIVGYFTVKIPMWSLIMLLTLIASIVCLLINNFWRLSIHSYGWGFASFLLLIQYSYIYQNSLLVSVIVVLSSGLVMSSRLFLGRHNNLQVYLGFAIGFVVPALLYYLLTI